MKRDHRLTQFNRLLAFEGRSFIKWKAFKKLSRIMVEGEIIVGRVISHESLNITVGKELSKLLLRNASLCTLTSWNSFLI